MDPKQSVNAEVIYPFLYSSFGQGVAVSKIVDFNVFDVVTILLVHLAGNSLARVNGRRLDDWRRGRLQGTVSESATRWRQMHAQSEWAARRHAGCLSSLGFAR